MSQPITPEEANLIVAAVQAAHPVAYRIIGDLQAGRSTYMDDMRRRAGELEAQHGPLGMFALIFKLALIADAHGARGDPDAQP